MLRALLQKCVKETKFAGNHKVTKYFALISLNIHVWFLVSKNISNFQKSSRPRDVDFN